MVPISTSDETYCPDFGHSCHSNSIYRSRRPLTLSNEGPYFFRSLVWGIYRSGQYSDFTIRVKGSAREFHVHRAVICPQSGIFEAACRGQFIEASTNSMTLTDDDPEVLERMIKYLYTHQYDDSEDWNHGCCDNGIRRIRQLYETATDDEAEKSEGKIRHSFRSRRISDRDSTAADTAKITTYLQAAISNSSSENSDDEDAKNHFDSKKTCSSPSEPPRSLYVYAIADKYLINPLKDLARIRFSNWAYSHWWTRGFVSAAREIFDNETGNYSELKEVILSTIVLHADTLLCGCGSISNDKRGEEEKEADIQKFMQDYSEVSVEVLRRTLDRTRIRQRGLEVDIADLESRVNALKVENKKIGVLQSRNHSLNKELLDVRMVLLGWKRELKNSSSSTTATSSYRT